MNWRPATAVRRKVGKIARGTGRVIAGTDGVVAASATRDRAPRDVAIGAGTDLARGVVLRVGRRAARENVGISGDEIAATIVKDLRSAGLVEERVVGGPKIVGGPEAVATIVFRPSPVLVALDRVVRTMLMDLGAVNSGVDTGRDRAGRMPAGIRGTGTLVPSRRADRNRAAAKEWPEVNLPDRTRT